MRAAQRSSSLVVAVMPQQSLPNWHNAVFRLGHGARDGPRAHAGGRGGHEGEAAILHDEGGLHELFLHHVVLAVASETSGGLCAGGGGGEGGAPAAGRAGDLLLSGDLEGLQLSPELVRLALHLLQLGSKNLLLLAAVAAGVAGLVVHCWRSQLLLPVRILARVSSHAAASACELEAHLGLVEVGHGLELLASVSEGAGSPSGAESSAEKLAQLRLAQKLVVNIRVRHALGSIHGGLLLLCFLLNFGFEGEFLENRFVQSDQFEAEAGEGGEGLEGLTDGRGTLGKRSSQTHLCGGEVGGLKDRFGPYSL
mmetsp:Transcript_38499/g.81660  ORF Transcript_38499/g.81660 Transcript_38499/m.81660 type:complete len:310 (-) Transcript_38499:122-1051(-)